MRRRVGANSAFTQRNMKKFMSFLWFATILDIAFLLGGLLIIKTGLMKAESIMISLAAIKLLATLAAQQTSRKAIKE